MTPPIPSVLCTVLALTMLVPTGGLSETLSAAVPSPPYGYLGVTGRAPSSAPVTIHVDTHSPGASDANPGTEARPLKTVGRAADVARAHNAAGQPITVLIHPGVYREAVRLSSGGTNAPITLQATEAGKAVISGSVIWTGWEWGNHTAIFTHPWPYAWGLAPIPADWPRVPDVARRREMVFVNGELLTQVLALNAMKAGSFHVDEKAHMLYIWAPGGINPNGATVEVAVRATLFAAENRANLTIRGLVFEHSNASLDSDAVALRGMTGLLVEDTTFRWNNWGGFGLYGSTNTTVRRSVGNHNGARGMSNWRNKALLYEDINTSYNNWRGAWGGFYDWAMGGIKSMRLHGGVFRHATAIGNQAWGFWLDTDNQNVTVEGGFWCGNLLAGGDIEASQGPISIVRTTACANGRDAILVTASQGVAIRDSVLYGSANAQQFEIQEAPPRTEDNWETGRVMTLQTQNVTLCGNAIVGKDRQLLIAIPHWALRTLSASRNDFWHPHATAGFWVAVPGEIRGGNLLDLAAWQRASGQDSDSIFADPLFNDPDHWDFTPRTGSPWRRCAHASGSSLPRADPGAPE